MTLAWPDCRNARDLGGLPTATGGRTRIGALIRSDNLDRLTAAGRAAFRSAGIARIVDLRSTWECEHYPSPFAADPTWRNRPVEDPDGRDRSRESLASQYIVSLREVPTLVAAAVGEVADAPPGPVVVHCHEGKDRTGVVVALLLTIAGVERSAIAWDYARSGAPAYDDNDNKPSSRDLPEMRAADEQTILDTLAYVDEHVGGVRAYLRAGGLTDDQALAIRRRLVASAEG